MLPSEIIRQLTEIQTESHRGIDALFKAEQALAEAEYTLDTVEQKAFLKAQGTVADRTALAKLESADARLQRDLRKAELNRIKVKLKVLEQGSMAAATIAKQIELEARL